MVGWVWCKVLTVLRVCKTNPRFCLRRQSCGTFRAKTAPKSRNKIIKQSTNFNTKTKTKDFMEQLQQGFSNSTPKVGSERLKIGGKV